MSRVSVIKTRHCTDNDLASAMLQAIAQKQGPRLQERALAARKRTPQTWFASMSTCFGL